ncbi:hypothetical protein I315_06271 [Cryptococcus gattii Ru294]|nr:hypothetical protein I315_06271 [Cryptococcus gattii Ru294]KIY31077.1 hypothetical protein I305_06539 [Cryptococcus gattii E566]
MSKLIKQPEHSSLTSSSWSALVQSHDKPDM